MQTGIIKFDEFELDLSNYKLRRHGRPVKLEKAPMELLILLAEREGQLVTREEIIARLWGDNVFVDTRQDINTAVRKIRLALHDDPDQPRILETVFGKGYRMAAPVVMSSASSQAVANLKAVAVGVATPATPPSPLGEFAAQPETPTAAPNFGAATTLGDAAGQVNSALARALFVMIQIWYLVLYGVVFAHLQRIVTLAGVPRSVPNIALVTGLVGAAAHIYLMFAVSFNYPGAGRLFRQTFPGLLVFDFLWAASPLFLFQRLGFLTLLLVAPLAFLPFSQRTVMNWAYPVARRPTRD